MSDTRDRSSEHTAQSLRYSEVINRIDKHTERGFYSESFSHDLSQLLREARQATLMLDRLNECSSSEIYHCLQEYFDSTGSLQFVPSQVVLLSHMETSMSPIEVLLSSPASSFLTKPFRESLKLNFYGQKEPARSGNALTLVHRFILKNRCPILYDRLNLSPRIQSVPVVNISDLISRLQLSLLPLVLDYIYTGASAIDIYIVRFHVLSELFRSSSGLCIDLNSKILTEILPNKWVHVISAFVASGSEQKIRSSVLVRLCQDEGIWRKPFLSVHLASVLWHLEKLASTLKLNHLQAMAEQLIGSNISVFNVNYSFEQSQERHKSELQRIILKFSANHWGVMTYLQSSCWYLPERDLWHEQLSKMEGPVLDAVKNIRAEVVNRETFKTRQIMLDSSSASKKARIVHTESDTAPISIRDEFPFLAGKDQIPDSVCLPIFIGHSAVNVFDDHILFVGGVSKERFHPLSKMLLYHIPSNQFKYVYCSGDTLPGSGTQPCVPLQKSRAYKLIIGAGKSGASLQPLKYSTLPHSSVYNELNESMGERNIAPDRLCKLDDFSLSVRNDNDVSTFENSFSESEVELSAAIPSVGSWLYSEQLVTGWFFEFDCRTLSWTSPPISLKEAFVDVGGSILYPSDSQRWNSLQSEKHALRISGEKALKLAARSRLSHSFVPLYEEDIPYRCHLCLFTDKLDACCCHSMKGRASGDAFLSKADNISRLNSTWIIQFGGYCSATDSVMQDLHVLSCQSPKHQDSDKLNSNMLFNSLEETSYKWLKVRATGVAPAARFSHGAVILPCSKNPEIHFSSPPAIGSHTRMLIYGGLGNHDEVEELGSLRFELHPRSHSLGSGASSRPLDLHWEKVVVTGSPPPKRHNLTMVHLPHANLILMYGGSIKGLDRPSSQVPDDVWCLVAEGLHRYSAPADAAGLPLPLPLPIPLGFQGLQGLGRDLLAAATAAAISPRTTTSEPNPTAHTLFGPCLRWEQVTTMGVPPSYRCRHSCTRSNDGLVFIFGGMDESIPEESMNHPEVEDDSTDSRLSHPQRLKDSVLHIFQMLPPVPAQSPRGKESLRGEWVNMSNPSSFVRFPGEPAVHQPLCTLSRDLAESLSEEESKSAGDVEEHLDVTFLAEDYGGLFEMTEEPSIFRASSSLLRRRSRWIDTILSSSMCEARTGTITLPASRSALRAFLKYICSDCILISGDSNNNGDEVGYQMDTLCALTEMGVQFDLPRLVRLCEGLLLHEVHKDDYSVIHSLLDFSNLLQLDLLRAACWARLLRIGNDSENEMEASDEKEHVEEDCDDIVDNEGAMWKWALNNSHAYSYSTNSKL